MNTSTSFQKIRCPVRWGLSGPVCLLLAIFLPGSIQPVMADMHVGDGEAGAYRIDHAAAGSEAGHGNALLSTGEKSTLGVSFPNGMDWKVGEKSSLMLESFRYTGPVQDGDHSASQWGDGYAHTASIATERASSNWSVRLNQGALHISSPHPSDASSHVITTAEVSLDLKTAAAFIRRTEGGGTVINVYHGNAQVTTASGDVLSVLRGTKITVTPDGQIARAAIEPDASVWLPAALPDSRLVSFPRLSLDVALVSPSS